MNIHSNRCTPHGDNISSQCVCTEDFYGKWLCQNIQIVTESKKTRSTFSFFENELLWEASGNKPGKCNGVKQTPAAKTTMSFNFGTNRRRRNTIVLRVDTLLPLVIQVFALVSDWTQPKSNRRQRLMFFFSSGLMHPLMRFAYTSLQPRMCFVSNLWKQTIQVRLVDTT